MAAVSVELGVQRTSLTSVVHKTDIHNQNNTTEKNRVNNKKNC